MMNKWDKYQIHCRIASFSREQIEAGLNTLDRAIVALHRQASHFDDQRKRIQRMYQWDRRKSLRSRVTALRNMANRARTIAAEHQERRDVMAAPFIFGGGS